MSSGPYGPIFKLGCEMTGTNPIFIPFPTFRVFKGRITNVISYPITFDSTVLFSITVYKVSDHKAQLVCFYGNRSMTITSYLSIKRKIDSLQEGIE